MKASLYNYRQSPRKVRLVASLIKGKSVDDALSSLRILVKKAGSPIEKLIRSSVANAEKNFGLDSKNLIVKNIRVDKGVTLKRSMPRARGSAFPINKRASNVTVILAEKIVKAEKETK
ncbi:MAG: 50S ribosomal protein L22 [Candidatus Lloydbacteria bacterium RIFCSPHIGHO2_01_FULL_41_20]|uniref:Large ribosomal subunit protein uL22 n=1 Tax=Candidatus Lloydbacteria bacterium RIFCSPHIGHO2_01_FULL_41_20 TaxID=1798657 RepID=A0A1G2CTI6_9BACT|nr:MAG: 50S ribosomal protein L22 [Candidatus Lloydbacteria bacterium RIFCSPHIGHO2_01_FULL_41_20]